MSVSTNPPVITSKEYTADIISSDSCGCEDQAKFTIERLDLSLDQPWRITSELGCDTHHSLDELLFWNLFLDDDSRSFSISQRMRQQILADFGEI